MARELPSAPKVYTTKYDNFRGVDFTNDPSNVWAHRSPNGLNMMPDLAGRPWKRPGWEVVEDAQAFIDCYNTATGQSYAGDITPFKVNYFEIGGEDYLAISNNLGLFMYSRFINDNEQKEEPYLKYMRYYYGEVGTDKESTAYDRNIRPDPQRAFFFEGQGKSGFYIFCTVGATGSEEGVLLRYDGWRLRMVEPYIPRVIISKGPGDTGGTNYEVTNMLTPQRMVTFYGDGTSVDFVLPEKANTSALFTVETRSGAVWTATTAYSTSDYSQGGITVTKVTFTNAPARETEDNVRITYSPSDIVSGTASVVSIRAAKEIITWKERRTVTTYADEVRSATSWSRVGQRSTQTRGADFAAPNALMRNNLPVVEVRLKTNATTWQSSALATSQYKSTYSSYSHVCRITVKNFGNAYSTQKHSYSTEKLTKVDRNGKRVVSEYERTHTLTVEYPIKITWTRMQFANDNGRNAFNQCSRVSVFGNGVINNVFMAATDATDYRSRVWWSKTADPTYFPDTNYIEAGSNDTRIAGMMKIGEYLGIIKQGQSMDSTIYLAYPTKVATGSITNGNSTETTYDDTYAIKSSIGGIGAISNGAFNILNDEPLFLSKHGVMGINPTNELEKQLRNRSYYINRRLVQEEGLDSAFSFVWRNMYILAVNNHCYILDGSQKSSWANEKTNLQYECYYWENCPVQCFARYDDGLWFTDFKGGLCRFKPETSGASYHDSYDVSTGETPVSIASSDEDVVVSLDVDTFKGLGLEGDTFVFSYTPTKYVRPSMMPHRLGNPGFGRDGDVAETLQESGGWQLNGEHVILSDYGITTTGVPVNNDFITINVGMPIHARWSTLLDDDGSAHYFKTLQKKGSMVVLYPQSSTGVKVSIKKDNGEPIEVGMATVRSADNEIVAPSEFYLKKKAKKYKRLQIIAENNGFDETFGIDEIVKCYTIGNYSRNR